MTVLVETTPLFFKKNWSDMVMFDFGSNDIPVSSVHLKDALESDCSND